MNRNFVIKCALILLAAALAAGALFYFLKEPAAPSRNAVLVRLEQEGEQPWERFGGVRTDEG